MRVTLALLGAPLLRGVPGVAGTGQPGCPCVEWDQRLEPLRNGNGNLVYRPTGSGASYEYPFDWGFGCGAWDVGLPPTCDSAEPPAWCENEWCFVDSAACTGATYADSHYFPGIGLTYSYSTCGSVNTFQSWVDSNTDNVMKKLLWSLESNVWNTVRQLENAYRELPVPVAQSCEYETTCDCATCTPDAGWSKRVDFHEAGLWLRTADSDVGDGDLQVTECLARSVSDDYLRVAASEMTSPEDLKRVGYQYFGDQGTGSIAQWPLMQWCPQTEIAQDWDSRRRPWYPAGATGAKDLIIVVDVSGSMKDPTGAPRWRLAKAATLALIDTLSWKDWAQVILFSTGVRQYGGSGTGLQSMTPDRQAAMRDWLTGLPESAWRSGGTDYRLAFRTAFEVFRDSTDRGQTSQCQKAIMFLTDGAPNAWEESDFLEYEGKTKKDSENGVGEIVFFTYALGAGLAATAKDRVKRLACGNGGVYYEIPDQTSTESGQLTAIMTQYFQFFASGQELCYPSYVRFADAATRTELFTGCMPIYDRTSSSRDLLGVNCMDANMLADVAAMRERDDWDHFICKISDVTKKCVASSLSECDKQKLRAKVGPSSVCTAPPLTTADCPCNAEPCEDEDNWMDSKGYFCDSWVADDCHNFGPNSRAVRVWGYDPSEQATILARCKRSCGNCGSTDAPCASNTCPPPTLSTGPCRACVSQKVSGADIEGCPMACPGQRTCPSSPAGGSEEESSSSSSSSASIGIIIGVLVGVLASCACCAAFYFLVVAKMSTPVRSTPVVKATPVHSMSPATSVPPTAVGAGAAAAGAAVAVGPRLSSTPAPVPKYWQNQNWRDEAFNTLVPCPSLVSSFQDLVDGTYKKVVTRDRRSGQLPERLRVTNVMRIENRDLWAQYCAGREGVKAKRRHRAVALEKLTKAGPAQTMALASSDLKQDIDRDINEVLLWHGTSPNGAMGIKNEGFRMSKAGTNAGSMFGPGIYLAENSTKSDEYAQDDKDGLYQGQFCLLLCRAVLGQVLQMVDGGESVHGMVAEAMRSEKYDSVLGDRAVAVGTYREFVIYKAEQAYPEYVILYNREGP